MEEKVGELWHRYITRKADNGFPEARVELSQVEKTIGVYFRALSGDPGLQISVADATVHGARRRWLQRLAGSGEKISLAWRDENYLRLPPFLDTFPLVSLNRDLYFWLAALASHEQQDAAAWSVRNQKGVIACLQRYPGLRPRYQRLLQAHLALRPDPQTLKPDEAKLENRLREALITPGSVDGLPSSRRAPHPVALWLHPDPPVATHSEAKTGEPQEAKGRSKQMEKMRRQAERIDEPEKDRGLITIRMENIFTWGEYVKVDRGSEDEEDQERAEEIARDLDKIAVSRGGKSTATTLRFDLDLPPEEADDAVTGDGIMLPEWDWRKRQLIPNHCRIQPMLSQDTTQTALPEQLRPVAHKLRRQFQALAPARTWHRGQSEGQEIDLEAYLRYAADRKAGVATSGERLYREMRSGARDLACLLMADLSLSTDTYINDHTRVIDVVRDSLYLFAESLHATGDQFGLYGFSSRKRDPVRVHCLKAFDEAYSGNIRGRIAAIKPGYYTRMGTAIRYGSQLLGEQPAGRRLLLILTDGKPNDLDQYEGRYGIEDTRKAIIEARQLGLQPFCVTIDEKGNDYLPHLFGSGGYIVIRDPAELPKQLPMLYAQLTA